MNDDRRPVRDPRDTAMLGLYASYRAAGTQAWLPSRGGSMRPLIVPDSTVLVDFGAQPERIGEVIVFAQAGAVVAHRLVGRRRRNGAEQLIVKGDAEAYFDRILRPDEVLGVARAVRPGGDGRIRRLGLGGRSGRIVAGVSRWSGRGARVARRLADRSPGPIRGLALRAIPPFARVPTRFITAPLTQDHGAGRR